MGRGRARPRRLPYVASTAGASADRHIFLGNLMPKTLLESRARSQRPDRGTWRGVNPRPDTGLPNLTCLPLNVVNFRCSVFKDAPDGDEFLL